MSYKPDEKDWMAYLYGEMEGPDKEKMERFLSEHEDARKKLDDLRWISSVVRTAEDKEVIAPPVFVEPQRRWSLWDTPYFKRTIGVAASLLLLMLAGRFTGMEVHLADRELRISFGGETPAEEPAYTRKDPVPVLTAHEVQEMINASLEQHRSALQAGWESTYAKRDASVQKRLTDNSGGIDRLLQEISGASQEQIRQYVAAMREENMQVVKDYITMTSAEQKRYIENLLVDFAQYLQQQRNNDLQLVQYRLDNLEQNTDIFKQETEQILSSIITTVNAQTAVETRH